MTTEAAFAAWRARCERALESALPPDTDEPQALHAAMHHAVLGGGKRLRPLLVYAAGSIGAAPEPALDPAAVAVELVHAYSLVHDDLPAMDDDALRRGRPTVHVAYGEATAILAGDALQTLAFAVLARAHLPEPVRVALIGTLAAAAGAGNGMAGGQAMDLAATGRRLDIDALRALQSAKTGALIRAAVRMGAQVAGLDAAALALLDRFAGALGIAFQIRDDLLDVEADTAQLGKTAGKDRAQDKPTWVSMLGPQGARAELQAQRDTAQAALRSIGAEAGPLRELLRQCIERVH
ncbi:MAG TPA: farnesyl diphosphate synthase [Xanthomonadaceae bacterium]|nr:farnesyl diphosphate synthase [Xanthomonadaceae bacterium]